VRFTYNDKGQTTAMTEEGFSPTDPEGKLTPEGTPIRRTTTYEYSRISGRSVLTRIDGPLPNGPTGTPVDSDITELRYSALANRIASQTHPTGLTSSFTYDDAGRVVQHTPMDGVPVRLTLDHQGRKVQWQRGDVSVKTQWNAAGSPAKIERNDGTSYTAMYDMAGRLVAVVDAQGTRREVELDSEGRMLKTQWRDAAGDSPFDPDTFVHDPFGRTTLDSTGAQRSYDALGRLEQTTDVLQRIDRHRYDDMNRLVAHEQSMSADQPRLVKANSVDNHRTVAVTRISYRGHATLPSGLDAANGAHTEADLDDFGRTVRLSSPDTGVSTAAYDEADRQLVLVDAEGNRTTLQHDPLGRLTSRVIRNTARPDEFDEAHWRYVGAWLVESGNAYQSDTYRRDDQGRIVERTTRLIDPLDRSRSHSLSRRFRFDGVGRPIELRLPDGLTLLQGHDRSGRPNRLSLRYPNGQEQSLIESIKADAAHGLREVMFGNGVVTTYQHDREGRIIDVVTATKRQGESTRLYTQHLNYDQAGRIIGIERDGRPERYDYDGFDRLVEVRSDHEHRHFAYDAAGNRTAMWEPFSAAMDTNSRLADLPPQQLLRYGPGSNRLVEVEFPGSRRATATRWEYGANGSPTTIGGRRYRYGVNGRLQQIGEVGGTLGNYRYNAGGERIWKQSSTEEKYFLYSENILSAEVDRDGNVTAHYVYLGHTPVVRIETRPSAQPNDRGWIDVQPSGWQRWLRNANPRMNADGRDNTPTTPAASVRPLFLHGDHLGALRFVTDLNTALVWRAPYDAFGSVTVAQDPDGDGEAVELNLRLPGQYVDRESGLYYNYHRDYDPALGRYIQSDPIGLAGGINTYAYVGGNPLTSTDPLGLRTCVLVTRNGAGVANHAALYIERVQANENSRAGTTFIFDPSGSYAPSTNFAYGDKASIERFADFHKKNFRDSTEQSCKDTSKEEEQRLYERALAVGPQGGPVCALSVSNVLSGSAFFPGVRPGTWWPGNLIKDSKR
jgi:RHS repeat-associated protein